MMRLSNDKVKYWDRC